MRGSACCVTVAAAAAILALVRLSTIDLKPAVAVPPNGAVPQLTAPPKTIGNGIIAEIQNSSVAPVTVLEHTLSRDAAYGVISHFWETGEIINYDLVLDYFVDGEERPSISFQPAMACGQAFPRQLGDLGGNGSLPPYELFSAGGKMGKAAQVGGWYHYHKVLFRRHIRVAARTLGGPQVAYVSVRGHEVAKGSAAAAGLALASGFVLPPRARLQLQRVDNVTYAPLSFVPVFDLPRGYAGVLYLTSFSPTTTPAGNDYIEGCWHLYTRASQRFPGIVLGTGVEDYFDSAYWFCALGGQEACLFAHPNSGLLHFSRTRADGSPLPAAAQRGKRPFANGTRERLSAYRFFDAEVIGFSDGGSLRWRVGDVEGKCKDGGTGSPVGEPHPVAVRSYVWAYTWPLDPAGPPAASSPPLAREPSPTPARRLRVDAA